VLVAERSQARQVANVVPQQTKPAHNASTADPIASADVSADMTIVVITYPGPPLRCDAVVSARSHSNAEVDGYVEARIASYDNTEIVLDADSPDGGWVVLNDVWHPWWFAEVDGLPAQILRANVLFRAVAVPPGQHKVRFTFRPLAGALAQLRSPVPRHAP